MKSKISLILITVCIVSFAISYVSAQMVKTLPGESTVENVFKRYAEKTQGKVILHTTYKIPNTINNIDFDAKSMNVAVYSTEETQARIEYYDIKEQVKEAPGFIVNGSQLKITPPKTNGINWDVQFNWKGDKTSFIKGLNIYLPNKEYRIKGRSTSGDINLSGINLIQLKLATTSGDINLKKATINSVTLASTSGDQNVEGDISILTTASNSGDQNFHLPNIKSLMTTSSSGDQSIYLETIETLTSTSSSGDIEVSGHVDSMTMTTSSGDMTIEQKVPAAKMTLISRSGDISIELTKKPNIKVRFTSRSGDLSTRGLGNDKKDVQGENHFTLGRGQGSLNLTTSSGDVVIRK